MGDRLSDKVAIITGGASGMGRAGVVRFLEEGAQVVVFDFNEDNGKELVSELEAQGCGDRVCFVRGDVAEESDIEASIAAAMEKFGRLDIIWNNAGVGGAFGPMTEVSVEDWDYTFAVMVRGVFLGTKHAARVMKAQGQGGSIINTSSIAALGAGCSSHAYSATKAAVLSLTKSTAIEFGADFIRANAILPGGILTPLMHGGSPEKASAFFASEQPIPVVGQGEDIANAALYFASDESRFVSGASLVVDGGLMAYGAKVVGNLEGMKNLDSIVGVGRGSTGLPPRYRRLDKTPS